MPGICGRGIVECSEGSASCRPTVMPGDRREICNGDDDNCDGRVDEDFDKDRDGYTTCSGDCNDRDPSIHPDAVERCDGIDNNCNGLSDEGFNVGGVCSVGVGACSRRGHLRCSQDGLSSVCDASPGKPEPEICDRLDNDCNDKVDDGLGDIFCGVGACKRVISSCVDGKPNSCVPGAPSQELCGNGIDDNCDGKIDEGFAELGKSCYEGIGACRQAGKLVCSEDKLSLICSARPGEPRAEICGNKIDDNCEGTIDTDAEGLGKPCNNGLPGECARDGVMACDASVGSLYCSAPRIDPKPEICDGNDNDCDGKIDNGVLNACGGCGELPGGIGSPCMVPDGDECGTGRWACSKEEKGKAACVLDVSISEGRECASDGNSCSRDVCRGGKCFHSPVRNGLPCDMGDRCSTHDTCIDGTCAGGTELSCDDRNACTTDSCDLALGCIHTPIGGGMVNSCGGCEALPADPGGACDLADKFGPCREGRYSCQPDGLLTCVQVNFARKETCDGVDENCDGKIDDGLGSTTSGIGACEVTIDNCVDGKNTTCVPRDPLPETCSNMGSDDDCNGVADDVAGLDKDCPIAIGTCILPGTKKCVGEADAPVCVPVNPRDAEDDDGNGVVNYCDRGASLEGVADEMGERISQGAHPGSAVTRIFDQSRTRAAMLPWSHVIDSVLINPETPDRAILLVSGTGGGTSGIAVMRAKDATASGALSFQTCAAAPGFPPEFLLSAGAEGSVIATSGRGYLRYLKIASQIPSAAAGAQCMLAADRIAAPETRAWPSKSGDKACQPERVAAIGLMSSAPLSFAGAVTCPLPAASILSKQRWALGIDIMTEGQQGAFAHEFVPFVESAGSMDKVSILPLADGGIFVAAVSQGKNFVGTCRREAEKWQCAEREATEIASPIAYTVMVGKDAAAGILIVTSDGGAYGLLLDGMKSGEKAKPVGTTNARGMQGDGDVGDALMLQPGQGGDRKILFGRERLLTAASMRSGEKALPDIKPLASERFEPVSLSDDIFPGGKFSFGRPFAMALIPLKRFGGSDLFAAFEIRDGGRTVGNMGFFFWNANEPPEGTLTDIRFDGRKGSCRLAFTDPTGDALTYRASIRAHHGGSLDNWIDGLERGILRFSVKGDASAVGMWPIEINVEASDQGGAAARSRAILRRDGTVESITESSSNP